MALQEDILYETSLPMGSPKNIIAVENNLVQPESDICYTNLENLTIDHSCVLETYTLESEVENIAFSANIDEGKENNVDEGGMHPVNCVIILKNSKIVANVNGTHGESVVLNENQQKSNNIKDTMADSKQDPNGLRNSPVAGCSRDLDYIQIQNESDKSTDSEDVRTVRKRKKRRHVDKKIWCKNSNQLKRARGEEYEGKMKIEGGWNYKIPKPKRQIKRRCNCKVSQKVSKENALKCSEFSDEDRRQIFTNFWGLSQGEKQVYINMLVTLNSIQRPRDRKESEKSRRGLSFTYFLKKKEEKQRVCKVMFLNTLDLGEWTVTSWKKKNNKEEENVEEINKIDERGEDATVQKPRPVILEERRKNVIGFFDGLPKMESHYCRARTQKLYLEPIWRSKMHLYNVYSKNWCVEKNAPEVSITLFSNIFDDMNLGLFIPKKDECSTCVERKLGNLDQVRYLLHQTKKNEARDEKAKDKDNTENTVYTMDLQSVLLAPKANVSTLYYKKSLLYTILPSII